MQPLPPATEQQPVRAQQTSLAGTLPPELVEIVFKWGLVAATNSWVSRSMQTVRVGSVCSSWRDAAHGNGSYEAGGAKQIKGLLELFRAVPAMGEGARTLVVRSQDASEEDPSEELKAAKLLEAVPNLRALDYWDPRYSGDVPLRLVIAMSKMVRLDKVTMTCPSMPTNAFLMLLKSWPDLKILRIEEGFATASPLINATAFPILNLSISPPSLHSLDYSDRDRGLDGGVDFAWLAFLATSQQPLLRSLRWALFKRVEVSVTTIETIVTSLALLAPAVHKFTFYTDMDIPTLADGVKADVLPLLHSCKVIAFDSWPRISLPFAALLLLPKLRNLILPRTPDEIDLPAFLHLIETRASRKQLDCVHITGDMRYFGERELARIQIIEGTCDRVGVVFDFDDRCDH